MHLWWFYHLGRLGDSLYFSGHSTCLFMSQVRFSKTWHWTCHHKYCSNVFVTDVRYTDFRGTLSSGLTPTHCWKARRVADWCSRFLQNVYFGNVQGLCYCVTFVKTMLYQNWGGAHTAEGCIFMSKPKEGSVACHLEASRNWNTSSISSTCRGLSYAEEKTHGSYSREMRSDNSRSVKILIKY